MKTKFLGNRTINCIGFVKTPAYQVIQLQLIHILFFIPVTRICRNSAFSPQENSGMRGFKWLFLFLLSPIQSILYRRKGFKSTAFKLSPLPQISGEGLNHQHYSRNISRSPFAKLSSTTRRTA